MEFSQSLHDHQLKASPYSSSKMSSPSNNNLDDYRNSNAGAPAIVELAKCNQLKFIKSVARGFKRYFMTCFKPMEKHSAMAAKASPVVSSVSSPNLQLSPNYYSEMNDEERAENIKSAIVYCKKKQQCHLGQLATTMAVKS